MDTCISKMIRRIIYNPEFVDYRNENTVSKLFNKHIREHNDRNNKCMMGYFYRESTRSCYLRNELIYNDEEVSFGDGNKRYVTLFGNKINDEIPVMDRTKLCHHIGDFMEKYLSVNNIYLEVERNCEGHHKMVSVVHEAYGSADGGKVDRF